MLTIEQQILVEQMLADPYTFRSILECRQVRWCILDESGDTEMASYEMEQIKDALEALYAYVKFKLDDIDIATLKGYSLAGHIAQRKHWRDSSPGRLIDFEPEETLTQQDLPLDDK